MSQLAERDHNLFGMKWWSGYAGWPRGGRQGELGHQRGVRARRAHPDHGELHPLHRRRRVHPLPQQGLPAGGALLGQRPHPGGDREARLGQDGRGAQRRRLGDRLVLRRVPEVDHGSMGPLQVRLHDGRGPEGPGRERERDRRGGVQPARRALRVGRLDPRQGARLQRAHAVLLRAGGHPHKHYTGSQYEELRRIPLSEAKPGDILYRSGHVPSTSATTGTYTSRERATCAA